MKYLPPLFYHNCYTYILSTEVLKRKVCTYSLMCGHWMAQCPWIVWFLFGAASQSYLFYPESSHKGLCQNCREIQL